MPTLLPASKRPDYMGGEAVTARWAAIPGGASGSRAGAVAGSQGAWQEQLALACKRQTRRSPENLLGSKLSAGCLACSNFVLRFRAIMREPQPGDHLRIRRIGYAHDAIYVGNGEVIHLWCEDFDKSLGRVRRDRLARIVGRPERIQVVDYGDCFDAATVLRLAASRLGDGGYHLTRRNCQHFARWCKTGEARSDQVERVFTIAEGAAVNQLVSKVAIGAIAVAAGEVTGAAGLMAGLARVGTTATRGIAVVSAAPALAAVAATHKALRDDPCLPVAERAARERGRRAAVGGAAVGVGASMVLLHSAGVRGLSAVGITTALKMLGGGTMLRGLAVLGGLPVVAVVLGATVAYRLHRAGRRGSSTMSAVGADDQRRPHELGAAPL